MTSLAACQNQLHIKQIVLATICSVAAFLLLPSSSYAAPTLSNTRILTAPSQIATHQKLELATSIDTVATNTLYPYDPAGLNYQMAGDTGISVDAIFTDPNGSQHKQPGFYYQDYTHELRGNTDWLYPTAFEEWRVRFSPHLAGAWTARITATDASGTTTSNIITFTVNSSANKGFIEVSPTDSRYFQHTNGEYFPALGYNLNYRYIDWINPSSNQDDFAIMNQHGIQVTRTWLSQWSIFGSSWAPFVSHNGAHAAQEPDPRLRHDYHNTYRVVTQPDGTIDYETIRFHERFGYIGDDDTTFFLWLSHDNRVFDGGIKWDYNPCMVYGWERPEIPTKPNTAYQISVSYKQSGIQGPRNTGAPYGFAIKTDGWASNCEESGVGNLIVRSNNAQNEVSQWLELTGTLTTTSSQHFLGKLYLALENVTSGNVFVRGVSVREVVNGSPTGPNLFPKATMDYHEIIDQRNSYALDKVLESAQQNNVYLKLVVSEKQDRVLNFFEHNGDLTTLQLFQQSSPLYYGDGRNMSASRWLQQAWWRYLQARWGYSPNIHSWELLNEGPPGNNEGHWTLTDEFGEYMHCGVFGEIESPNDDGSPDASYNCTIDHPNDHMVTTSMWSSFPYNFWNNTDGVYNDVDYADVHKYIEEGKSDSYFDDAAGNTITESAAYSAPMPIMRGELGWIFEGVYADRNKDLFNQNASDGLWLHNMIWAGINPDALIEHYWVGSPTQNHIFSSTHDHRDLFGNYYRFIKDIPLNNGNYYGITPLSHDPALRIVGQQDTQNNRAHLWVQHTAHTWRNVHNNTTISPVSDTVSLTDFQPNITLAVETWDTITGTVTNTQDITTDANGTLSIPVSNLTTDTAFKIGDYTNTNPPPPPKDYRSYLDLIKQFATNAATIFDLNSLIRSILN